MIVRCTLASLTLFLASPAMADAQTDPAGLEVYRQQDADLIARGAAAHRIVFMGDSITQGWDRDHQTLFSDPTHINRGISGQTLAQMRLRFGQDVIALHPETLVLLGGTNDFAGNGGPVSDEAVRADIRAMVEQARASGIRVILASILPTDHYHWATDIRPAARIVAHNRWLRDYAAREGLAFVDFHMPMATGQGAMRPGLSGDGVHPNAAGYAVMERILSPVIGARR